MHKKEDIKSINVLLEYIKKIEFKVDRLTLHANNLEWAVDNCTVFNGWTDNILLWNSSFEYEYDRYNWRIHTIIQIDDNLCRIYLTTRNHCFAVFFITLSRIEEAVALTKELAPLLLEFTFLNYLAHVNKLFMFNILKGNLASIDTIDDQYPRNHIIVNGLITPDRDYMKFEIIDGSIVVCMKNTGNEDFDKKYPWLRQNLTKLKSSSMFGNMFSISEEIEGNKDYLSYYHITDRLRKFYHEILEVEYREKY